jgi:hypothetical protein
MPRLLVFAPCEKVIISQGDNTPTLITVLTGLKAEYEPVGTASLPAGTLAQLPIFWSVFALWKQETGDESKEFQQVVRLISPTGKNAIEPVVATFKLETHSHRQILALNSMPIGEPGEWTIQLFLTEKGSPISDTPYATCPIMLDFSEKKK